MLRPGLPGRTKSRLHFFPLLFSSMDEPRQPLLALLRVPVFVSCNPVRPDSLYPAMKSHSRAPHSRRTFLKNLSTTAAAISIAPTLRHFAAIPPNLANDPLRPQYHLLPAANWMNDPNGPIYWQGNYHMFFQYNPNAAVWGDMHWAHAISPDMIHWKHLPVALAPTKGGPDQDGCFSGSAVDDHGTATFIYTGVSSTAPEQATLRDGTHNFRETQLLATSTDPNLLTWKKIPQPVLQPPNDPQLTGFRDPFLWKEKNIWYLGVGSGQRKIGGRVLLYRSIDLRHWDPVSVLASGKWNGKDTPDTVDSGEMWECPDFFKLGDKYVLIYSTERKVFWESGELDPKEMVFHSQKQGLLDSGAFYAPKTQTAANGDRILWGWIPETRPESEFSQAGWAGCMSLPRVLSLDATGQLKMRVVSQAAGLRSQQFSLPAAELPASQRLSALRQLRIDNLAAEISVRVRNAAFTMKLMDGPIEFLTLSYDPVRAGKELQANSSSAPLPASGDQEIIITLFLDGSVVEMFANEVCCLTSRVYQIPAKPLSIDISEAALAAIRSMRVWQMKPISFDRLTT
jgi:beta-fructofuranosidase